MPQEPLKVLVATYEMEQADSNDLTVESTKVINYHSSSDRKWLANHCMWALHNNRGVQTEPYINESN